MIEPIPEEIVERTWQEVGGFNPGRPKKEMTKLNNLQPELLSFLMGLTDEMDREVRELTIYIFFVVYRVFQKAHGKIRRISSEEITECYKNNEDLMERLVGAHDKFLDRIASSQVSGQPYVVRYVADDLMEDEEGESDVVLTEQDKGFLFVLLKTAIDVLDKAVESKRS